jgi:hypothetical protein
MYKKTVGNQEFTILEDSDINCGVYHQYKRVVEHVPINPNGEYVKGYGRTPVFAVNLLEYECAICGDTITVEEYEQAKTED